MIRLRRSENGRDWPARFGHVAAALKRGSVLLALLCLGVFPVSGPVRGADDTILLDEAQFLGKRRVTPESSEEGLAERPALSTFLTWEGDEPAEFNIPQEILNDLTRPDLSFFSGPGLEGEEKEEIEAAKGE